MGLNHVVQGADLPLGPHKSYKYLALRMYQLTETVNDDLQCFAEEQEVPVEEATIPDPLDRRRL